MERSCTAQQAERAGFPMEEPEPRDKAGLKRVRDGLPPRLSGRRAVCHFYYSVPVILVMHDLVAHDCSFMRGKEMMSTAATLQAAEAEALLLIKARGAMTCSRRIVQAK